MKIYSISMTKPLRDLLQATGLMGHFYRRCSSSDGILFDFSYSTYRHITHGRSYPDILKEIIAEAIGDNIDRYRQDDLNRRLIFAVDSYFQDPPPEPVIEEAKVFLLSNQEIQLEYHGRGLVPASEEHIPSSVDSQGFNSPLVIEVAGGHRSYHWMTRSKDYSPPSETLEERFRGLKEWFNDPNAHTALCLGGGGMKMVTVTGFLRLLDALGVKPHINEIWGTSMGAIMGYFFSIGLKASDIEQIAYDYYNRRFDTTPLEESSWQHLKKIIGRLFSGAPHEGQGLADIKAPIAQALDKWERTPDQSSRIPFYSIATNLKSERVMAISVDHHVPSVYRDIITPGTALDALAASAAIPVLFSAYSRKSPLTGQNEMWIDGVIGEEIPITFPYLKWKIDRTGKPLKLFYIDSGSQLSHWEFLGSLEKLGFVGKLMMPWRLIDTVFHSRFIKLKQILEVDPDVDILGIRMDGHPHSSLDPKNIPKIIQSGRKYFFEECERINSQILKKRA